MQQASPHKIERLISKPRCWGTRAFAAPFYFVAPYFESSTFGRNSSGSFAMFPRAQPALAQMSKLLA